VAGSSTPEGQQPKMLNSGAVKQRLNEAVAAGKAKSSATWKVGNVSERAKVRQCTAVGDIVFTGMATLRMVHNEETGQF